MDHVWMRTALTSTTIFPCQYCSPYNTCGSVQSLSWDFQLRDLNHVHLKHKLSCGDTGEAWNISLLFYLLAHSSNLKINKSWCISALCFMHLSKCMRGGGVLMRAFMSRLCISSSCVHVISFVYFFPNFDVIFWNAFRCSSCINALWLITLISLMGPLEAASVSMDHTIGHFSEESNASDSNPEIYTWTCSSCWTLFTRTHQWSHCFQAHSI